ncbi:MULTISPECIES: TetR/AcrR family transcriptional regulator [unclassified Streptomyces]|uniref:TetR/AcrR family transcriptional regulator n=1 Tax=Streptomyces TaxID=1883 RepID=UPI0013DCC266|nr:MULTISPECIES: TetR/AcrR family transcriptional regulator [unclassified Streptomyces]
MGLTDGAWGPHAKTAAIKRQIVDACTEAFGETGLYGATMKDIAKRAGISYTGLLHHFACKVDLLAVIVENELQPGLMARWILDRGAVRLESTIREILTSVNALRT